MRALFVQSIAATRGTFDALRLLTQASVSVRRCQKDDPARGSTKIAHLKTFTTFRTFLTYRPAITLYLAVVSVRFYEQRLHNRRASVWKKKAARSSCGFRPALTDRTHIVALGSTRSVVTQWLSTAHAFVEVEPILFLASFPIELQQPLPAKGIKRPVGISLRHAGVCGECIYASRPVCMTAHKGIQD